MNRLLYAAATCWMYGCAHQQAPTVSGNELTAITNVSVIDVETGAVRADRAILIRGSRIIDVVATNEAPQDAQVIDARGTFAIPGLWDMHAHALASFEQRAPILLANGVTGIRQPGGSRLDSLRMVKARLRSSSLPSPRLVAAGVLIDGNPPVRPAVSVVLAHAADAPRIADSLLAYGADFFKVYARLKPEPFFALMEEARRRGIPVVGHVPTALTPIEISDAGLRSIEHVFELPLACSSREMQLRARRSAAEGTGQLQKLRLELMDTILSTYDEAKCHGIAQHLARNRTFVTPTLYLASVSRDGPRVTRRDSTLAQFFGGQIPEVRPFLPEFTVSAERSRELYRAYVHITQLLYRSGVPILAGTDTQTPLIWLGFSLHDELRTLVRDVGMTPLDALRAATLNPALYFSATDTMGTIQRGRVADIVLLSANPLLDIANTALIHGVVANGIYISRAQLDATLSSLTKR